MIGKPGPFQIIASDESGTIESPMNAPRRRYDCQHYETCLAIAAALNWDNFTCRGCCEQIDEALFWRARQAIKKDSVVEKLCDFPSIQLHGKVEPDKDDPDTPKLRIVGKS